MLDYEEEYKLAIRLSYGIGVVKDEVAALEHFKHSAYQGYYPAMMSLAFRYLEGEGTMKNVARAFVHFKVIADEDDCKRAQYMVGLHYEYGVGERERPYLALKYYKKAGSIEKVESMKEFIRLMEEDSS